MPSYDIWDVQCASLVRSFESEDEALVMVRRILEEQGPESLQTWALGRTDHTGKVYIGQDLLAHAGKVRR